MNRHSYTVLWWCAYPAVLAPWVVANAYGFERARMAGDTSLAFGPLGLALTPTVGLLVAGAWMSKGSRRGLLLAALAVGAPGLVLGSLVMADPSLAALAGPGALLGTLAGAAGLRRSTRDAFGSSARTGTER